MARCIQPRAPPAPRDQPVPAVTPARGTSRPGATWGHTSPRTICPETIPRSLSTTAWNRDDASISTRGSTRCDCVAVTRRRQWHPLWRHWEALNSTPFLFARTSARIRMTAPPVRRRSIRQRRHLCQHHATGRAATPRNTRTKTYPSPLIQRQASPAMPVLMLKPRFVAH